MFWKPFDDEKNLVNLYGSNLVFKQEMAFKSFIKRQ